MQRWLNRALPEKLEPLDSVSLVHEGELEVRGKWTPFKARGIYKVAPLSFKWRARLKLMPGVWVVAEDGYQQGLGWGGARVPKVAAARFEKAEGVWEYFRCRITAVKFENTTPDQSSLQGRDLG